MFNKENRLEVIKMWEKLPNVNHIITSLIQTNNWYFGGIYQIVKHSN